MIAGILETSSIKPWMANKGCQWPQRSWETQHERPYRRRVLSGARRTGLTVQRAICTCMGAGLAVRRVLCTSSQLAWTCKESLARSSLREIQSIDILVPKIWYHVPHPSNDQNITKMTSFQRQNDVFWIGFGMVCCGGRKRARSAARVARRASEPVKWNILQSSPRGSK